MFVHGAADRGAAFARVGRLLPDATLVRYDRRGYGRSAHLPLPGVTTPAALLASEVDDLLAVATDELAVDGAPLVVVGHSVGGLTALATAARSPVVDGVVAYEPPMPWTPWWGQGRGGGHSRNLQQDPGDTMERFLRSMIGDGRWEALPPGIRQARRAEGPALVRDLAAARGGEGIDWSAVRVPVVLGVGSATDVRHRRAVDELAAVLPAARVVEVPGARHGGHLTHPAALAGMVEDCLGRIGVDRGRR